jgi:hypothetical protein
MNMTWNVTQHRVGDWSRVQQRDEISSCASGSRQLMSGRDREKQRLNRYSQERQGLQPEVKAKLEAEQNRKLKNSKRQSQEIRV